METILTIDFDIIMWENIESYNCMVEGISDDMSLISERMNIISSIQPDYNLYYQLSQLLVNASKSHIPIYFIDSHEECSKYLTSKCRVINIDHHHDLGYGDNISYQPLSCGNWAFNKLKNGIIDSYLWLHERTSIPSYKNNFLYDKYKIYDYMIQDINLQNLINYNKIIISYSLPWIPVHIRPLFLLWEHLFKGE